MNYENSRPIGGEASGGDRRSKNLDKSCISVFMTFEELQKT